MKPVRRIRIALIMLAAAALACSTVTSPGAEPKPLTPTPVRATRAATEAADPTEAADATATDSVEPTATDLATPEPAAAYLGDVTEDAGVSLTALQIADPAPAGSLYQPTDGTRLVAVEVVLGNVDLERFAASATDLTLIDGEGFSYPFAVAAQDAEALTSLALAAGERLRGWAAFEVPADATLAALRLSPSSVETQLQVNLLPRPEGAEPLTGTPRTPPDLPALGVETEAGGYTLAATALEDPTTPGFLYTPVAGRKLVAVEIVVGNVSGAAVTVNSLFAYLVDTEGYVYPGRLFGRDGQIETLQIGPGDKLKGWVSFELPDGATPEGVRYLFDLFSGLSIVAGLAAP